MRQMVLSAFADEIAPELDTQIRVLQQENIGYLELRSVDEVNIADFTVERAKNTAAQLADSGIGVSALGSPLGKTDITASFDAQPDRLRRLIDLAHVLGTRFIRIFSFYIPEGEDADAYTGQVLKRMEAFVRVAEGTGITLLHENEKAIFGDIPRRCALLLRELDTPVLRATYDFSNFVQCDVVNYPDGWQLLRDKTVYIHLKDSVYSNAGIQRDVGRQITGNAHRPVGLGDGACLPILQELAQREFDGFLSLEPLLGEEYGATGEERFRVAAQAAKQLLAQIGQR